MDTNIEQYLKTYRNVMARKDTPCKIRTMKYFRNFHYKERQVTVCAVVYKVHSCPNAFIAIGWSIKAPDSICTDEFLAERSEEIAVGRASKAKSRLDVFDMPKKLIRSDDVMNGILNHYSDEVSHSIIDKLRRH